MVVATSAQRYGLPSVRCSVTAKSTGEPCQLYAIPGSTVCHMHGAGAPQVKVAARARALLADVASRDPRPIGDAILDAINTADVVHRYLKERLIGGEDMSAGDLDMLMSTAERVVSMGKAAAITKLVELKVGQIHEDAKRISLALGAVMHILTDHIDGLEPRGDLGLYSSPATPSCGGRRSPFHRRAAGRGRQPKHDRRAERRLAVPGRGPPVR